MILKELNAKVQELLSRGYGNLEVYVVGEEKLMNKHEKITTIFPEKVEQFGNLSKDNAILIM